MSIDTSIPAELIAQLQDAANRAAAGIRDREEMRKACARIDKVREDVFRKQGLLDIGVPAIRELRGAPPSA